MQTTLRNATYEEMLSLLSVQHEAKHDRIVSASRMYYEDGVLIARGMGMDGPHTTGRFLPTDVFDSQIAGALEIPLPYVRRMRKDRVDLLDANINGWLQRDPRNFFVRTFIDHSNETAYDGIGRSLLSDRYRRHDNLDVVAAVLAGVRESGVDARVVECNVSETRMHVKMAAPFVKAYAPKLLAGYRDPWGGNATARRRWAEHAGIEPGEEPILFAGIRFGNSETGSGATTIVPEITVLRCLNGLTMTKDAMRSVHLGERLEEGIVDWSADTQKKNLELLTAKTRDAVATFLNVEYVEAKREELERKAGIEVEHPSDTIEYVSNQLRFTKEQMDGILGHFIRGGQTTVGGIMQAVTSYAQGVEDPDTAWDLQNQAVNAMDVALRGPGVKYPVGRDAVAVEA